MLHKATNITFSGLCKMRAYLIILIMKTLLVFSWRHEPLKTCHSALACLHWIFNQNFWPIIWPMLFNLCVIITAGEKCFTWIVFLLYKSNTSWAGRRLQLFEFICLVASCMFLQWQVKLGCCWYRSFFLKE
jgi:hypothetical protein